MSVTVVTRRRARRGEGPHLVALGAQLLERRVTRAEPLSVARVFQSVSNADDVLFVSVWDDRAAYWAALQADHSQEQLDALCTGEPERYFFHRMSLDEDPTASVAVVDCAILTSAPAKAETLLSTVLGMLRPMREVAPGFVLRYLGQDEDEPRRLLLLRGWDSLEALEDFRIDLAIRFEAEWCKQGATVEHFVGYSAALVEGTTHRAP